MSGIAHILPRDHTHICWYHHVALFNLQTALGAAHLHGYRVQTVSSLAVGGKKHAFELIPPTTMSGVQMRHYYLATDSEHDRKRYVRDLLPRMVALCHPQRFPSSFNLFKLKSVFCRWLAALEYSIDRWINIGEKSTVTTTGGVSMLMLSGRGTPAHPTPPPLLPLAHHYQQQLPAGPLSSSGPAPAHQSLVITQQQSGPLS